MYTEVTLKAIIASPNNSDNFTVYLASKDEKLVVAEGYFAKVTGSVVKTIDGKKDVLEVAVVILKNVSN